MTGKLARPLVPHQTATHAARSHAAEQPCGLNTMPESSRNSPEQCSATHMKMDAPSAGRLRKFVPASPAPIAVAISREQLNPSEHKSIKR